MFDFRGMFLCWKQSCCRAFGYYGFAIHVFNAILRRSANASNRFCPGNPVPHFQMEAKTGNTFSDVAGIDEAKE